MYNILYIMNRKSGRNRTAIKFKNQASPLRGFLFA